MVGGRRNQRTAALIQDRYPKCPPRSDIVADVEMDSVSATCRSKAGTSMVPIVDVVSANDVADLDGLEPLQQQVARRIEVLAPVGFRCGAVA